MIIVSLSTFSQCILQLLQDSNHAATAEITQ